MEELYLELGNIKPTQAPANSELGNLMDLLEPAGFIPDLNLAETASALSSGLNSANEAQSFTKSANDSSTILSGIALTLTDISNNLGKASRSIVNSTENAISNTLSISSDLVKIEPKKVELSIKDINSLSDLVKELQKPKDEKTDKTSPDAVLTTALKSLPTPTENTGKPKLDIEVFSKALINQESDLANSIQSTVESGGDLTSLFENTGTGVGSDGLLGNLSDKFSSGVKQAVMEYEINAVEKAEKEKALQELLLDQNDPSAILASISNQPTPVKEIETPNFNKAIAKGLTDVAESNSKIVSQTNIVNQNQAAQPTAQPKPIELLPTSNQSQNMPVEKEEDSMQATGAMIASDPTLAAYMLQMLNIMKSGQLKVKISN
jgi:hypothetical protein